MAEPCGKAFRVVSVVPTRRHITGSTLPVSRGSVLRARRRPDDTERLCPRSHRKAHVCARRADTRIWVFVPAAGVSAGAALGAVDGFAASGHPQRDRRIADAAECDVVDRVVAGPITMGPSGGCPVWSRRAAAGAVRRYRSISDRRRRAGHAGFMDDAPAKLAAVVYRNVYQRCAYI